MNLHPYSLMRATFLSLLHYFKSDCGVGWFLIITALGINVAHAQISFTDVTVAAGVAHQSETWGASWGDLNGDGYPDLYANNHRTRDSLYLNKGNGTFLDTGNQVRSWVYIEHADTHGGAWADFDNDGDQDLMISVGTYGDNEFLVNEHGMLVNRTVDYGITLTPVAARLPIWVDYNGDRLPDFVMANRTGTAKVYKQNSSGTAFIETTNTTKMVCNTTEYGQLFDYNGDGRLDYLCTNEAVFPTAIYNTLPMPWQILFDSTVPTSTIPLVYHVADDIIGDFNNDQRMDFFLLSGTQMNPSSVVQGGAYYFEANLTSGTKGFNFISAGTVTFNMDWNQVDVVTGVGLSKIKIGATGWHPTAIPFSLDPSDPKVAGTPPETAFQEMRIGYDPTTKRWTLVIQSGTIFSEAYLMIATAAPISKLTSTGLWAGDKPARPTLLMNHSGGFTDETIAAGLSAPVQCGSVTAGDFDNDMDLDLYLACRTGASNIQNILYENKGNGTFVAVPNAGGAGGPVGLNFAGGAGTADSTVTADYDVDGFLDLFVTNGLNLRPLYYGGPNKLFHNQGNANHWIELQLIGTRSERDAIGARITATANGVTQLRVVNGGYHRWSQEHTPSHFGLAGATTVDLRVEWPSGTVETFTNVPANKLYRITESSGIATVTPGVAPAYPCGSPSFNGAVDVGVFVWKDCTTGDWRLRTTAGGGNLTYSGTVTSSSPFVSVTVAGLEAGDSLDSTTNPSQIVYQFATSGNASDGVNFAPQNNSVSICLKVVAPVGAKVFYGPLRVLVPQSLDLETQAACGGGVLLPVLSVAPVSVSESAGQASFTIALSAASTQTVTVSYASADGTATAADYTGVTGTLTFAPGVTSKTVAVPILDDTLAEGSETFTLALNNPVNATLSLSASQATGTSSRKPR